jgi:ABC-type antimicrobial peptide transport system permease subunit
VCSSDLATLIFLWANYHLRYNREFPNAENIYEIGCHQYYGDEIHTFFVASGPLSKTLDETFPEIKRNARMVSCNLNFKREDTEQFYSGYGSYIDSTIFTMLRMEFVRGNPATAFPSKTSLVISEKMAQRCFNDDDPIGKIMKMDETNFEVTGVYKNLNKNTSFTYEWMAPFQFYENIWSSDQWNTYWLNMYVEIVPNADVNAINQKLKPLVAEKTDGKSDSELFIYPVTQRHLYSFREGIEVSDYIKTVRLFLGIGALILLIACINFMNLATARSQKRTLEVGVRKAFGAKRFTLLNQFLGESGMVTAVALLIAVGLVLLCLPYFNGLLSMSLVFDFTDWNNWAGLLGIGVICSLLAGSYPAFYLSSFSPMTIFQKLKIKTAGSVVFIRKGLVVFQFAVSFVLICITLVIFLQIRHAGNREIGFDKENVVTYLISANIKQSYVAVQNELMASGIVENAGMCCHSLFEIWSNGGGWNWQGKSPEANPLISVTYCTPGLIETAKLTLEDGRDFTIGDAEKNLIIINRTLANIMGEEGRIGGRIRQGEGEENTLEIIGIVNNFVFNNVFQTTPEPLMLYYHPEGINYLYVRLKSNANTAESLEQIDRTLQKFSPNQQFNAVFMDDSFKRIFYGRFTEQKFSFLFAALAVFISCLGLFGLSSFSAEQRRKEIGIRKTLGATVGNLVGLLIRNFFVLIGISFIIAIPIAWYVTHRWLADFQYRIEESWLLFAVVGVLVIVIAALTVGVQSLRAAMANPVKVIQANN